MVDSAVVPAHQERAHQGGRLEVRRRLLGQEVQGHARHLLRKDRAVQVGRWRNCSWDLTHKCRYCRVMDFLTTFNLAIATLHHLKSVFESSKSAIHPFL